MYGIFFDCDGETIMLPVNPAKFTVRAGSKNKTADIISQGEVNILKDRGLDEFSMKILLPARELPFGQTNGEFSPPSFYLDKFREYKTRKKPVRLIITRTLPSGEEIPGVNSLVSFEDYTAEENAGEEGDFWVDIKLKEYRSVQTKVIEVEGVSAATGKTQVTEKIVRGSKEPAAEYKVAYGDTLWTIAKRELNDGSRYMEIADLNGIQEPNNITVGQILKLR